MRIGSLVKTCSKIGRHGWYQTDYGFLIRKPINEILDNARLSSLPVYDPSKAGNSEIKTTEISLPDSPVVLHKSKIGFWQTVANFFKNLFK